MSKKLLIGEFKWVKKLSIYAEQAMKNDNDNNDYEAILEVDVE